ncbi:hemicentin-2-like [Stylophora pistillata]|uniref:hemicentin-2-like n=1 Tax=Stylophora pistillata TaxID=50429 RepID=UPI000C03DAE0|nr:hemicentin-2-like [Stylophora pistillata]
MRLLYIIVSSYFLFNAQQHFLEVEATITWILPSPQRGPLAIGDTSFRTTVKELDGRYPELRLEWDFTLSGESLTLVSWRIENIIMGSKALPGAVTLFPAFKGDFNISPSDPATLIIYNKTAADGKKFTCSVATDLRVWDDVIRVAIYEQTRLISYSGNKTMNENSNLSLFCNTTGKPTATIIWTRVLDDGSNGNEMFVGNPWVIRNISRTSDGTYRCTAYNGFGNTVTRLMHVDIVYPVRIVHFPTERLVASLQAVSLRCPAEGNPPPRYSWVPCWKGRICNESTLSIAEVHSDDVYTCTVTNGLNTDTKNISLFIAGNIINVTLIIASEKCEDGKYDDSSLPKRVMDTIGTIFASANIFVTANIGYTGVDTVSVRCGSLIIDLVLRFNHITKEKDVIAILRGAALNGAFGELNVSAVLARRMTYTISLQSMFVNFFIIGFFH